MLQGVIKSMPAYRQHHRAGVCWPLEGREFVVADQKLLEEVVLDARKLYDERRSQDPRAMSPDMPVVYDVAAPTGLNPHRVEQRRGRVIDIPTKPVVMDEAAYDYVKQAFGVSLSCEPVGGMPDVMAQAQKIAQLEQENAKLKAKIVELEAKKK